MGETQRTRTIVGGVDTHKDLHVAAVVDDQDRFLASESFATTRQGYRLMLAWMQSFGNIRRVGVEATGTYGPGVLRYFQKAGVQVLEVTGPDKHDCRARASPMTSMQRRRHMRPSLAREPPPPRPATE